MLTILIPSYNHAAYVKDCLDAVKNIPFCSVIVIDDGSTDKTTSVIQNFIEEHQLSNIKFIQKQNSGLVSSLNLGLEMVRSEFLYMVASDDIPLAKGIADCVRALQLNPHLQFCIGGGKTFQDDIAVKELPIYGRDQERFLSLTPIARNRESLLNYPTPLLLQSTVFRTSALNQIGGWDTSIILDDYPTFVKLLRKFPENGTDFIYRPELDVVRYRQHATNSYRDLARQYSIVKQSLEALASGAILSRAVGKALAYHLLVTIRARKFSSIRTMISSTSLSAHMYAMLYLVGIPTSRVFKLVR